MGNFDEAKSEFNKAQKLLESTWQQALESFHRLQQHRYEGESEIWAHTESRLRCELDLRLEAITELGEKFTGILKDREVDESAREAARQQEDSAVLDQLLG